MGKSSSWGLFSSKTRDAWAHRHGMKLEFSGRGKAYRQCFHRKLQQ